MTTTAVLDNLVAAYREHPRIIANEGGARSSKTYSTLQLLYLLALYNDKAGEVTSVVSETFPHLKRGAIRDFQAILVGEGKWDERRWNRSDYAYTLPNGAMIEFFSADSPGKVLGAARKRLFINEAINIPFEIARQLFIRTTETVFVDYNPAYRFWFHERYAARDDVRMIHSTYKDNPFLADSLVREIESQREDERWWRVYGEGLVGELAGVVYRFEQVAEMPAGSYTEIYGLDFGFTHDPTALVRVLAHSGRKEIYVDEVIYDTGLMNDEIAARMKAAGVDRRVPVYADCAEPKSIAEIRREGFNVVAASKDAPVRSEKMRFQVQWLQGWKMRVTQRSLNIISELRNYVWATDKDGRDLNTPIDRYNHALDALRYAVFTHFAGRENKGKYDIRIV